MLVLYLYMKPLLLLLTTTLLTAYGFQREHPADDTDLGYELDGGSNLMVRRNAEKSSVWLGPRLGRRKRSEDDFSVITQDKNGGAIIEILQDTPWALVPLKGSSFEWLPSRRQRMSHLKSKVVVGSSRRSTTFTPRLGRDSDEEYSDNAMEVVYGKTGTRTGNHAAGTSFTPRLGRHAILFKHHHL